MSPQAQVVVDLIAGAVALIVLFLLVFVVLPVLE